MYPVSDDNTKNLHKILSEHFDAPNNTEMVFAASVQFINIMLTE